MKKIYFIIAVLCIASLFASCNHEQSPEIIGFGDEVEVEMNIVAVNQGNTRAAIAAEDKINNLSVLVFKVSGEASGSEKDIEAASTFEYYRHAWLSSGTNYRAVLKTGSNLRIYLAANAKELIEGANLQKGETFGVVRNKLILTDPDTKLVYNDLPMWGIVGGKTTISESDEFVQLGKVNLLRSVASADLVVIDNILKVESAGIVLATSKGFLTHEADNVQFVLDEASLENVLRIKAPKVPSSASYDFGNGYSWKHATSDNKVENKLYMFENDATSLTAPAKRYTKMIVQGKYNNSTTSTFYPLAFRKNDKEKVQAARNRKFELTVTKVHGPGFSTVDEAINSEDVNMGYEVVVWDEGYRDNIIIVDGPHYVSFSGDKTILLANEKDSDALRWFSTNALEWNGAAPTNLKWSFGKIDNNTAFATTSSISNSRFKIDLVKDTSDATGESYYLKVTALADYKEDAAGAHTATLSIRFGRIEFEITLEQVQNGWADGGNQNENL